MEHSLWNTGVAQGFLFLTSNCGLCVTEYIVFLWKESVEGASESLIFSSLINVLSNPASDCPAYGQLFFAELFIFTSEGAGTESQSSLPCSLTPLCWKQEPGYYLRVAVALLSQPGTVNFAQTHGGWGGVGECTCKQIPYSLHLKEKSLSDTSPFLYCLITSWDAWERILVLIHFAQDILVQVFPLNLIQKVDFQCRKEWKNGEEAAKVDGNQRQDCWGLQRRVTLQESVQKLNLQTVNMVCVSIWKVQTPRREVGTKFRAAELRSWDDIKENKSQAE